MCSIAPPENLVLFFWLDESNEPFKYILKLPIWDPPENACVREAAKSIHELLLTKFLEVILQAEDVPDQILNLPCESIIACWFRLEVISPTWPSQLEEFESPRFDDVLIQKDNKKSEKEYGQVLIVPGISHHQIFNVGA